jgi:hypothetical protein
MCLSVHIPLSPVLQQGHSTSKGAIVSQKQRDKIKLNPLGYAISKAKQAEKKRKFRAENVR